MAREQTRRERFGRVRAILQEGHRTDPGWCEVLFALLEAEYTVDPQGYAQEWLPYLKGFEPLWSDVFRRVSDKEHLAHFVRFLPFAWFEAWFSTYRYESIDGVLESPHAGRLRRFYYHGHYPHAYLDARYQSRDTEREHRATHGIVRVLACATGLKNLKSLELSATLLGEQGCALLAGATHFRGVKHVNFRCQLITEDAIRVLADSALFEGVERLVLERNKVDDAAVQALTEVPRLRGVIALDLSSNGFGVQGAEALASIRHWERIEELCISYDEVGDEGFARLVEAPWFGRLKVCVANRCGVGTWGIEAFAESVSTPGLRRLDLRGNQIDDDAAEALSRAPLLRGLHTFNLQDNPITRRGRDALLESEHVSERVRASLTTQLASSV